LFLRTGVIGRRAWRSLVWLGVGGITTSYGVVVQRVTSDTWADRIGLREGDVLLTVDGAPLFSTRDLGTVQRLIGACDEVAATWARAGEHREDAARV
jgi:S1-C subfamily serine protease